MLCWCDGRASTKICMPPCRRLLSWHASRCTGVVVRWQILARRKLGRGPAIVPIKACRGPRGRPRRGSCRGSSSSGPMWTCRPLIFMKVCMLPCMHSQILALTLSMVSELSASRAMALLVMHRLPRQGGYRERSSSSSILC